MDFLDLICTFGFYVHILGFVYLCQLDPKPPF